VDGTLRASPPVAGKPATPCPYPLPGRPGRLLPLGVRATQVVLLLTVLVPLLIVQAGIYYSWFQSRRDLELQSNLEMARAVAGASRSTAETMAPFSRDLVGYAGLSLLVSLVAMAAALTVGRRITVPLSALRRHALAVGRGECGHRVEPAGPTELMDLGSAFNRMADELQAREQGLKRSEAGLRFLAEAGDVLAASLDCETTLTSVAHLAVPRMADWCIVDMADEHGAVSRMVAIHVDPAEQDLMRELHGFIPDPRNLDNPIIRVLRSGEPELITQVPDQLVDQMSDDPRMVAALRRLNPKSLMIVPLIVRGRTLGTILLASGKSGRYDSEDLALVKLLARRAALAVDNARLYGEAQEAVAMRDEFFSVAAHELKTPITSLRGFAQLAIRQLDKEGTLDPVRSRQSLEVIDQQSKKLSSLVTQLLDVSRLEAGRLKLNRLLADIVMLADAAVSSIQGGTAEHRLTLNAPPSLSAFVDPLRLEQVLTNLIDNAVKYSPHGGEIDVDVWAGDEEAALISVRDHGIGIPRDRRSRIFDRFYQAHSESYFGGMGLGLYISREIVILHGGHIRAEFPEDGGTRFVVSLPRRVTGDGDPSGRME
jgi:signal transduction histidine kinase/HAMP domain-containing protein